MDNYSSYQQQLSVVASEASSAAGAVTGEKAEALKRIEANRFQHQVIEGITTPVGVDTVESAVKGAVTTFAKTEAKQVLGEAAFKDYAEGGIKKVLTGGIKRGVKSVVSKVTGGGSTEADDALTTVAEGDLIPLGADRITAAVRGPAGTALRQEVTDQAGAAAARAAALGNDVSGGGRAAVSEAGKAARRAAGLSEDATDEELATATSASAADDWNPIGILATAGLGLATVLLGAFEGHHPKKHPITAPPVSNASTQFGT